MSASGKMVQLKSQRSVGCERSVALNHMQQMMKSGEIEFGDELPQKEIRSGLMVWGNRARWS